MRASRASAAFSDRESEVTATWLADAVQSGKVRRAPAHAGGAKSTPPPTAERAPSGGDEAVTTTCKQVSSVNGLYDCS
ncbi:MAG: hypothetical protein ACJ77G_19385, partial [Solirubrobacteraceae bacterium]